MAFQVIMPKLTYEMQEGMIAEWLCSESETVSKGQPLFLVETDKAAVEVPADEAGVLLKILVEPGATVPVSTLVAWIGEPGEALPETSAEGAARERVSVYKKAPPSTPRRIDAPGDKKQVVRASPVAKRLARELGVDLEVVQRQVGAKRVREADVRAYAAAQPTSEAWLGEKPIAENGAGSAAELSTTPEEMGFSLLQPTPLQRTMATRLTQSAAVPQFAAACEVDLTNLERLRRELLLGWEAANGYRLTYTHILAALVSRALEGSPMLNATWAEGGIRLYRQVNLGLAMATERGLVVPVVHGANQLSLQEIGAEIVRLRRAADRKQLLPQDLDGGTFTLTNIGMMDIDFSVPVLNPPQTGILAIGAKRSRLVFEEGEVKSIPIAWITLVADHRVVDGAAGAVFLARVKQLIQDPGPAFHD
jgi:pyruvate dehydrogenase E2 component (dihydrolipoamide acetyltransferase)